MILCYLGLGSNLNSPERQLRKAVEILKNTPNLRLYKQASFYYSKAWGRKTQPHFCNTVVSLKTRLNPQKLLRLCQQIEVKQGRVRRLRYGARTLDIDILLFGKQTLNCANLKIPHPRLHERDFVLQPLLEIVKAEELLPFSLTFNYNAYQVVFNKRGKCVQHHFTCN